jgi:hypothetical protein
LAAQINRVGIDRLRNEKTGLFPEQTKKIGRDQSKNPADLF